jgi:hypothetical protein
VLVCWCVYIAAPTEDSTVLVCVVALQSTAASGTNCFQSNE